jgi:hypothetical protein
MTLANVNFEAIEKRARHERAEAVHRLLVKPLVQVFHRPAPAAPAEKATA